MHGFTREQQTKQHIFHLPLRRRLLGGGPSTDVPGTIDAENGSDDIAAAVVALAG